MEYILNFVIIAIEILCLKNFIEIFAEKNKLNKKIIELEEVMLEIENNNIEIIRIRDEIKLKVDRLTEEINLKLKPIIDLKVSELAEILEKREEI